MTFKKLIYPSIPVVFLFLLISCRQQPEVSGNRLSSANNTLMNIQPSATSSATDFDFLEGKWTVQNRKLKQRLASNTEWQEFESELHMRKTLQGLGNLENYYAVFNGKPFEGQAVRLFDPQTRLWTVYWMDSNTPVMDMHPVKGSFENKIGKLYAADTFNGKPIIVLYQWDATDATHPKWSQAFSDDGGQNWEWNWEMVLSRVQE